MGKVKEFLEEVWEDMAPKEREKHLRYVLADYSAIDMRLMFPDLLDRLENHFKANIIESYCEENTQVCPECKGRGNVAAHCMGYQTCYRCKGSGEIFMHP